MRGPASGRRAVLGALLGLFACALAGAVPGHPEPEEEAGEEVTDFALSVDGAVRRKAEPAAQSAMSSAPPAPDARIATPDPSARKTRLMRQITAPPKMDLPASKPGDHSHGLPPAAAWLAVGGAAAGAGFALSKLLHPSSSGSELDPSAAAAVPASAARGADLAAAKKSGKKEPELSEEERHILLEWKFSLKDGRSGRDFFAWVQDPSHASTTPPRAYLRLAKKLQDAGVTDPESLL